MELTEARRLAQGLVSRGNIEQVWLQQALGRVLGENIFAERNMPAESRALVDGFAVLSSDTRTATKDTPCTLARLEQHLGAGDHANHRIGAGECLRILTGAPLPVNCDAVVPEECVNQHDGTISIDHELPPGQGVAGTGSEIAEGELLLPKTMILTPTRLALMAALGYSSAPVYWQPCIAFLATGNELREIGEPLQGPYNFCNNRHLLAWLASLRGAKAIHLGIARDDPELIAARMEGVEADLIVSTGGVGRGDRDFISAAWQMLGVEVLFEELNLVPGRRSALGTRGGQIFAGLPGSPWGAQLVFEQIVVPMLLKFQGIGDWVSPSVPAVLETAIKKRKGFYKAVRGTLQRNSSKMTFRPVNKRNRSLFATLRSCLSYILIESHMRELPAGTEVQVHFHDFPLLAFPLVGIESAREGYYA